MNDQTPIVINVKGNLELSSPDDGAFFDLAAKGTLQRIAWPQAPNNGWLVFDRDGSGTIDSGRELFGNYTVLASGHLAPNGFIALAELDRNGDGVIDLHDPDFVRLAVWLDTPRDGTVDPSKFVSLESLGIVELAVGYKESRRVDRWHNLYRYRAPVKFANGSSRFAYDVFLRRSDVRSGR